MKSLLKRATARPLYLIGIVISVIAILFLLWWVLSPSTQEITTHPKPSIITNQKIITPVKPSEASAPATTVASTNEVVNQTNPTPAASAPAITPPATPTTLPATTINATLPKDTTTAAEELDRLKDEQSRLKERKKELSKQLAISNKIIALKDQQLKELGQTTP